LQDESINTLDFEVRVVMKLSNVTAFSGQMSY